MRAASTLTLALSLLATGAAVAAPMASASSPAPPDRSVVTTSDPLDDVYVQGDNPDLWIEYGTRHNVDLVASRVRHAPRKVVTTAWFSDLVRTTDKTVTVFWIHTSAGRSFRVQHATGPGIRAGQVVLLEYVDGRIVDRTCKGLTREVSYADDLMRVTVPRPCLGRPAWVRYHGSATALTEGPGETYTDAMMSGDPVNDLYSRRIPRA